MEVMKMSRPSQALSTHSTEQEQDIAGYLTHSASESSNLARKFRRNCRALERYQSKWEERIGKTQDDRKKMEERYKSKKAENEEGLPWLKIPDLPKRVSRNAHGVTKKYAKTSDLDKLLKTQYVAETMKGFIPPARRARELKRAPAERCLEAMGGDEPVRRKRGSSTTRDACPFQWDEATEKRFLRCQKTMKQNIGHKTTNWGRLTMLRMLHDTDSEIKQGRRLTYKAGGHGDEASELLLSSSMTSLVRGHIQKEILDMPAEARETIEEQVSSTLTHEAARDLRAWTDNRSNFLAKKAQRLERNNSFREHRAAAMRARSEDAANAKKSARRIQAWLRGPRPSRPYDDSGYRQDVKRWAKRGTEAHDRRRHYLARGQLTGGPYNDFSKLYTHEDRERAAVLLQRTWRARKFSWCLKSATQKMQQRRQELEKRARELQAGTLYWSIEEEDKKKAARERLRLSKLVRDVFHGGHSDGPRDNLRAKLVHWIRYAGRWAPRMMQAREIEMMRMLEGGIGHSEDYGYALEVACREGHRDGIIFFLSTPGMVDLVRPYMVKCTVCSAEASHNDCFALMLDQLNSQQLAELADTHPALYRSCGRRPSAPIALRRRRSSLGVTQGVVRGSEHTKLLRFARRKAGNVVRAWRLHFDPRCSGGKLDFENFVTASKEAGFIGDYATVFLEAQGLEPCKGQAYLRPSGCVTFHDLFDHKAEGTTLRPSEGLAMLRGTLNNTVRNSGRLKGAEPTERWVALFETTGSGRRISRDHFKQVCERWRLMPPEADLNTLFDWLDVDRDDHLLESDFK
ncbi:hypothetical protein FOL46_002471 [Perkinsus olseni]|uniref:Uncharacterized protein n=1 Tax=Perkinsus olseni TaxID=32597 RepID=A0A7J6MUD1_PEROL|nr:hypothetical protein FOL46_002471 [Perkinsus olseni]